MIENNSPPPAFLGPAAEAFILTHDVQRLDGALRRIGVD